MKSKEIKRKEALERAKNYTYENSRAKRLGTATKEEWEAKRNELL